MRAIILLLTAALLSNAQDAKEAALGAQLARDIRQRTTAIDNPAVQDYVERIGRKLAAEIPDGSRPFTFALISDDSGGATHEPLSLPGGYIFISANLIRSATDEAELAGMLAHAMAHVTLPLLRSNGGSIPLIFVGGWNGLGLRTNESLVPISFFETQRDNEARADAIAVQAMSAAGYDPEALTRYVERVQPPPERSAKVFAALPDRNARVAAMRQAIAELPARVYPPADPDELGRMQEAIRTIPSAGVPSVVEDRPRPALRRQN